jgi:class 3 adenylate cyclase
VYWIRPLARTKTVSVTFTDLVSSTELASRLVHDAYEALRQEHFTALRTAVAAHSGTEVNTTGAGLMLCFDSAAAAGQILVSDLVRMLARGKGHTFTSVGELTLTGLPEPFPAS